MKDCIMAHLLDDIQRNNKQYYQDFYTFIINYKQKIINKSNIVTLTSEDKVKYQNRYNDLLYDLNLDIYVYWILFIINDMQCIDDIDSRMFLYVPFRDYINKLVLKYAHIRAQQKKTPTKL